ncbi:MAG: VCBS domain-containing protein, partial [Spongiibacteraceae bacterium]
IVNCAAVDNAGKTDNLSLRAQTIVNRHIPDEEVPDGSVELPAGFLPADISTQMLTLSSGTLSSNFVVRDEYEEEEEEELSPSFSCSPTEPSELGLYAAGAIATAAVGGAVTSDTVASGEPSATSNSAPENTVPDSLRATQGQSISITGLSISDVDGGGQYRSVLSVEHGSLSVGAGGQISNNDSNTVSIEGSLEQVNQSLADVSYIPEESFLGSDTLTLLTEDSSATEILTDTDSVAIQVTDNQVAQIAGDQSGDITEDSVAVVAGTLTSSDVDDPDNSFILQSNVAGLYGSFSLASDGAWSYNLDNNSASVNALDNGSTVSESFTVASIDGTTATVSITINGANDVPVAVDDSALGDEDGVLTTADVLANDSDPDNALTASNITGFSQASNGVVVDHGNGTFSYTPAINFNGSDSFSYTLDDGAGGITTGNVAISVAAQNDAPVNTIPDALSANRNAALPISGIAVSDVDAGSDNVTVNLSVQNGLLAVDDSAAVQGNGSASLEISSDLTTVNTLLVSLVYTPDLDFIGDDSLTINSSDNANSGAGGNLQDSDVLTITVLANQAATIGGDLSGDAVEGSAAIVTGALTASDPDDTDNEFQPQLSVAGAFGVFDLLGNGDWSYVLDNANSTVNALNVNDSTSDSFAVASIDGTAATVVINISGANDAPVSDDDTLLGDEDTILT